METNLLRCSNTDLCVIRSSLPTAIDPTQVLTVSRDRQLLVESEWDSTVGYRTSAGPTRHPPHRASPCAVTAALTPNNRWLATSSGDNTIRVWDLNVANPEETATVISGAGQFVGLAISPDGRWVIQQEGNLTVDEWTALEGRSTHYAPTCDNWPAPTQRGTK